MIIKIMTYNVHRCVGRDRKTDFTRIAKVIDDYRPDVVALQELDVNADRTDNIDQPHKIAKYLNMHYHFYSSMQVEGGEYGNAILSCFPLKMIKAEGLPKGKKNSKWNLLNNLFFSSCEARGSLWVELDVKGKALQIINTHLGLSYQERKAQISMLLGDQWLNNEKCRDPVIFLGDLNDGHRSKIVRKITKKFRDVQEEIDSERHLTFLSHIPFRCIDHIFIKGNIRVTDCQVSKTKITKMASDHLPLIAEIEIL